MVIPHEARVPSAIRGGHCEIGLQAVCDVVRIPIPEGQAVPLGKMANAHEK
jgi:hypothetical protein